MTSITTPHVIDLMHTTDAATRPLERTFAMIRDISACPRDQHQTREYNHHP